MTAPTLSRERAVEIARKRIELFDDTRFFSGSMQSNIIAALQDAFAEGAAQGEADRRRLDWIQVIADKHFKIEIARSLFRGGYELGWFEEGVPKCPVTRGTLRNAIDAALAQTKGE